MRILILIFLVLNTSLPFLLYSQHQHEENLIHGFVFEKADDDNLIPLPGVNVYWAGTNSGTSTDENGHWTKEYKNMLGQVILTETEDGYKTWYVYDDFGLLRCVIPPMSAAM